MRKARAILLLLLSWLLPLSAQAGDSATLGISLFEQGDITAAQQFFSTFVEEQPTDAVGAFYLGRTFFAQEQYEDAIEWLEKAVLLNEQNSDYHLWLGRAYGYQAQRTSVLWQLPLARRVRKHFERAVELNPDNIDARADLAEYYLKAPWFLGGSKEKAEAQAHEISQRNLAEGLRVWRMIAVEEANQLTSTVTAQPQLSEPPSPETR
jgi:tetratricopeptide (TPR) repeat protein